MHRSECALLSKSVTDGLWPRSRHTILARLAEPSPSPAAIDGAATRSADPARPTNGARPAPFAPPRPSHRHGRPTLSFCITTRGPAERVRALLSIVRPHVDEIVLAVDRDGGLDTLDHCADLADRRLTYEFRDTAARLIGWVLHECTSDWILRLDDDELPSTALLEALPELLGDRYPLEYGLRRRWLWGDRDHYIASPPWTLEFQTRLLRNVAGQWSFDGRVHSVGTSVGEQRLVDLPIYHGALLMASDDERRRKALRYESLRPGLEFDGYAVNALYLPEDEDVATAAVPAPDRPLIDMLLDGCRLPAPRPEGSPVHSASADEINRFNTFRTLPPDAYRARIDFVAPPRQVNAAVMRHFEVVVHNDGGERWPSGLHEHAEILLGYRWRDVATRQVVYDGRAAFRETVRPGRRTRVVIGAPTPSDPGDYRLEVDVVHEHIRWFKCEAHADVRVETGVSRGVLARVNGRDAVAAELTRLSSALSDARRRVATLESAAAEVEKTRATRRYRLLTALARPLDAARQARRRQASG